VTLVVDATHHALQHLAGFARLKMSQAAIQPPRLTDVPRPSRERCALTQLARFHRFGLKMRINIRNGNETMSRKASSVSLRVALRAFPLLCMACADDPADSSSAAVDTAYLAATNVSNGDDWSTLIGGLSSLERSQATLAHAHEFFGFADAIADPARPGVYFVSSAESPTIQRFELGVDGPVPGETLSFAQWGLSAAPGSTETAFAPDGTAYSVNYDNEVVIAWDPDEMSIRRTIDLNGLTHEGYASVYPISIQIRDGRLFLPVSFINFESVEVLPLTVLGVVDLATDEVTLHEDTRCSGIRSLFGGPDGALYGATDGFFATQKRLHDQGTAPCVLRIKEGDTSYEPDYQLAQRELVESEIVGDLSVSADGTRFFFNAFDEGVSPIAEDAIYSEVASAAGWTLYEVSSERITDGDAGAASRVEGLSPGARNGLRYNIAERSWITIDQEDYASSQLFDVSTPGKLKEGVTVMGSLGRVVPMRPRQKS
jgi:hypothetical protein